MLRETPLVKQIEVISESSLLLDAVIWSTVLNDGLFYSGCMLKFVVDYCRFLFATFLRQ